MKSAIGEGLMRNDHRAVFNQMCASNAHGKDVPAMKAIIGEESLTDDDKKHIEFLNRIENDFQQQWQSEMRNVFESLDIAWETLHTRANESLRMIDQDTPNKCFPRQGKVADKTESQKMSIVGICGI
jgi:V-type H+-transporting ATPase subunit B